MAPGEEPVGGPTQPFLSVVKGQPSAEELAALTAVVLSLGTADAAAGREAHRPRLGAPAATAARADAGTRRMEAEPGLGSWGDYRIRPCRPSVLRH
ncbi:MAG TPA: hypothetical protein DCR15_04845 [Arthrobacter bacterium]|nr:hypothetical protein [Arthrobacter sp.]